MNKPALIVIDVQNEYFAGGALPLWNNDATLAVVERAIAAARARNVPVVLVRHVLDESAPFFREGSAGVDIHPRVLAAAPDAPVITKRFADAFEHTALHETLQGLGVDEPLLCGMMTHHCITYTAMSRRADDYRKVTVLKDACTTLTELVHGLALSGLSTKAVLATVDEALG